MKQLFSFCIGEKSGSTYIWGTGITIPATYFNELLPAVFIRKMVFSECQRTDSEFKWVFTGRDGGITVVINKDSVVLQQRYYNSFGFNSQQGNVIKAARYPQQIFTRDAIRYCGVLSSIAVSVTHDLNLSVLINDSLAIRQITQIDVSRHQLQFTGAKGNFCGKVLAPETVNSKITINKNTTYQTILGFGGITSPVAYHMLSEEGKKQWWNYLTEYNLLIQREYPNGEKLKPDYCNWDNLADATPHYYGDNFPNGEISDFSYNKQIQQKGGTVIFEFWQLPPWAVDSTEKKYGQWKLPTRFPLYQKYVEAVVNYCKTSLKQTGSAPGIVGIQNEIMQPDEVWQKMTLSLREGLDKAGFGTIKIHSQNASFLLEGITSAKAFSEKKEVWDALDYTSSNLYDYQNFFTNPDGFDKRIEEWKTVIAGKSNKPFLALEMSVNDGRYQSGSYKTAFLMGELYHKNLVLMNASALGYCWLLINNVQGSFSESRSLFTIDESNNFIPVPSSYQLRIFGCFSRHILKGMKRIDINSDNLDLLVSGYSNGKNNTLILINKGIVPQQINLNCEGFKVNKMEIASMYQENKEVDIPNLKTLVIEPGMLVTLFQK
ncbi:MAG: hypothetical protein M0R39_10365 [Prolixibacteraceae bacterium]|nr:hypothetical protein [Prolixibacteraceae bacterium]